MREVDSPLVVSQTRPGSSYRADEADPITTEVIRHGLNSTAGQMKWALAHTAFSPIIYEVLDFAVALYDREVRLLAQAPSLPLFMGTLSFCVEGAVKSVGGEENLDPGDIILLNWPYESGSHPQDAALVMPVFVRDELIGYAATKEHWLDIGAKSVYCTDTTDVFQEGTFFPGVKLFQKGELVSDIYRTVICNSRMPDMLVGDLNAQVTGARVGCDAFARLVERHGLPTFLESVEQMFNHGETVVRECFETLPDGRYVGHGQMDDNGVDDELIPFEIAVEVEGSTVRVDFSKTPDAQRGPMNCPFPGTVSATRLALSLFAGGGEAPNEGMFRPVEIVSRPGSMFHPMPPAPCFLFSWVAVQAVDVIYAALAEAVPGGVPACSGSDILGIVSWGRHPVTGELWGDGPPHPTGQGGHARGDGASALQHYLLGNTRLPPAEVYETKTSLMVAREELAADSCGPGRHRGGLGIDKVFESVDDSTYVTVGIDRTKSKPWGLMGGGEGRPNSGALHFPDGTVVAIAKATEVHMPKGTRLVVHTAGGGGFGSPAERKPEAVHEDLRNAYLTEDRAREDYPHAFAPSSS